uniref:VLRF1 domain-containing protein n=1 Tax=Moniliophthora roreri TaxID=221103 RepID=A0A0W0F7Q6_MONRR
MYYLYSLPRHFLDTLTPRNLLTSLTREEQEPEPEQSAAPNTVATGLRTCNVCLGISFDDVDHQRAHFRTDWHRYNVKARLNGGQPVSEQDFTQLLDALEDSISGSESNDSEESSNSDAIVSLLNKHRITSRPDSPTTSTPAIPQTPISWFHSPPSTQIGVYRAIFPLGAPPTSSLPALKELQQKTQKGRKWAMFMVAGGHFAGAVIRVSRPEAEEEEEPDRSKKKLKAPRPNNEVLKHKTFHRYTTRRKQGGSQSLNDNAKGNAKSAGALLRRYGEQALRDDIRNLLSDWSDEINDCELIFIRASGSNRKIFLDYDGSVISKGDERLRTFPFPTRRPVHPIRDYTLS